MNKTINKLIEILKEHINQNNSEIRMNQDEIERMLSGNAAGQLQKDLDAMYASNRQLQDENSDFIRMQQELSDFRLKYNHIGGESVNETPLSASADQLLMLTVSGKLEYNAQHPKYNNPEFFHQLLKYYENKEDYEMCDKLLRLRKSL